MEAPDAVDGGVLPAFDLQSDAGHVLQPDAEVHFGGLGGCLQFVNGLAGSQAVGQFVVDAQLGRALGVLAPVVGKIGSYFHGVIHLLVNELFGFGSCSASMRGNAKTGRYWEYTQISPSPILACRRFR